MERTLFFNVLPLAGAGALCYCLAEQCHEFAIAVFLSAQSPTFYIFKGVLVACESRVGSQILLGAEFVGWFGLVLDYLWEIAVSFSSSGIFRVLETYPDVMELHFCGSGMVITIAGLSRVVVWSL